LNSRRSITDIRFKIFIDFDGTITTTDVGEEMFLKFGDAKRSYEIVQDWIDEKITSQESWIQLCKTIDKLDMREFDTFIDEIPIDVYFRDFVKFCAERNYEIFVLSDGLDYYIKRIFAKERLEGLRFYSNKAEFGENNVPHPSFPHTDEECSRCANCKRNHIIDHSSDDDITIYIGDGYSDTCPAQHCDYIFAKKSLLKYCECNRVSYFPYKNFNDVKKLVEKLSQKNRIKKRHTAELKRKAVYRQG